MAKWEFFNESDDCEGDDTDPSFSFYDFKKWMEDHPEDSKPLRESVKQDDKEALKEEFKNKTRSRVEKNVQKKLSERKKKN